METEALLERLLVLTLAIEAAVQHHESAKMHALIQQRQRVLDELKGYRPVPESAIRQVQEMDARIAGHLQNRMHQIAERLGSHRKGAVARRAYRKA
jgi:hypothetical protein